MSASPKVHSEEWRAALRNEYKAQTALIARLDFPPNVEYHNTGMMGQIRAERLDLLKRLLEFEPAVEPTRCVCGKTAVAGEVLWLGPRRAVEIDGVRYLDCPHGRTPEP